MKLAILIPSGPKPESLVRLDDILHSFSIYAPSVGPFILINDGNSHEALTGLIAKHGFSGTVLQNPRTPGSSPWRGGLTYGLAHGFAYLRKHFPEHHVLRMDDDALVIRPFLNQLADILGSDPRIGQVGSVNLKMIPDNKPASMAWSGEIMDLSRMFTPWPRFPRYRANLFGVRGALRKLIQRALKFNYTWAYHANGGAYLITAAANQEIGRLRETAVPGFFSTDEMTEDVLFALLIQACGLRLAPQQAPGDVFASCWKGLAGGPDLQTAWGRQNAIIHSLKDHAGLTEHRTREWFRNRRSEFARANTSPG